MASTNVPRVAAAGHVQKSTILYYIKLPTTITQALLTGDGIHGDTVLLGTTRVGVQSISDEFVALRAMLDSGSQKSFITKSASELLRLRRRFQDPYIKFGKIMPYVIAYTVVLS